MANLFWSISHLPTGFRPLLPRPLPSFPSRFELRGWKARCDTSWSHLCVFIYRVHISDQAQWVLCLFSTLSITKTIRCVQFDFLPYMMEMEKVWILMCVLDSPRLYSPHKSSLVNVVFVFSAWLNAAAPSSLIMLSVALWEWKRLATFWMWLRLFVFLFNLQGWQLSVWYWLWELRFMI